jgi:hypothetical protein
MPYIYVLESQFKNSADNFWFDTYEPETENYEYLCLVLSEWQQDKAIADVINLRITKKEIE